MKNMNKKIFISIGILVIGIVLISGFYLLSQNSEKVIVINSENDLEGAVDKNVFVKADLYASKLPILKLGDTWIYCWDSQQKDMHRGTAVDIIKEYGLERFSNQSIKVKVWGKLTIHQSEFDEEGSMTSDQLIHGNYEIIYYRIETVPTEKPSECIPDRTSYEIEYGLNECDPCCSKKCYHLPVGCVELPNGTGFCSPSHMCGEDPGKVKFEDIQSCESKEDRQDCYWQVIYDAIHPKECQYDYDSEECKTKKEENARIIFQNNYCKFVEDMAIGVNDECYSFIGNYFPSQELCNKINNEIYRKACIKNISSGS